MTKNCLVCVLLFFSIATYAQKIKTLRPNEIAKLLPSRVKSYAVRDSKSSILEIGSLRYSLSEKTFVNRERTIKILLFDYAEAPIMLNQSVKKWEQMPELETDSVSFFSVTHSHGHMWESEHPRSKRAQLLSSINNRFFLTLEAENATLDELREFFKNFDLEKFPK